METPAIGFQAPKGRGRCQRRTPLRTRLEGRDRSSRGAASLGVAMCAGSTSVAFMQAGSQVKGRRRVQQLWCTCPSRSGPAPEQPTRGCIPVQALDAHRAGSSGNRRAQLAEILRLQLAWPAARPGTGHPHRWHPAAAIPTARANSVAGTRPLMLNQSRCQHPERWGGDHSTTSSPVHTGNGRAAERSRTYEITRCRCLPVDVGGTRAVAALSCGRRRDGGRRRARRRSESRRQCGSELGTRHGGPSIALRRVSAAVLPLDGAPPRAGQRRTRRTPQRPLRAAPRPGAAPRYGPRRPGGSP